MRHDELMELGSVLGSWLQELTCGSDVAAADSHYVTMYGKPEKRA